MAVAGTGAEMKVWVNWFGKVLSEIADASPCIPCQASNAQSVPPVYAHIYTCVFHLRSQAQLSPMRIRAHIYTRVFSLRSRAQVHGAASCAYPRLSIHDEG